MKKIYHVSAPFEVPYTGDVDYGNILVNKLKVEGIKIEYLKLTCLEARGVTIENIRHLNKGVSNLRIEDSNAFISQFENWMNDPIRKTVITHFKDYIVDDAKANGYSPILSLQLRPPNTGFAFTPRDMEDFKKLKIQVNVTCHEYQLNAYSRTSYQSILHGYFKEADTVSFFNFSDFTNASRHANSTSFSLENLSIQRQREWKEFGHEKFEEWRECFTHTAYNLADKVIMTRVPPTIEYKPVNFDEFQQRKPHIVTFGSIRDNKGFKEAIDLAKFIKEKKGQDGFEGIENIRVKIVGTPLGGAVNLMKDIIEARFDQKVIHEVLKISGKNAAKKAIIENIGSFIDITNTENEYGEQIIKADKPKKFIKKLGEKEQELGIPEKAPIDIYIDLTPKEVSKIFNEVKYAVKFDNKGWANNASAHISPLVNGCILYTGWGMNTSKEVLEGGEYADAIVFLANKYGLRIGCKLTIKQQFELEKGKHYRLAGTKDNNLPINKDFVTCNKVLADILNREKNSLLNEKAFNAAKKLLRKFTEETGKEFVASLVNQEQRYEQLKRPEIQKKLIKLEVERLQIKLKAHSEVIVKISEFVKNGINKTSKNERNLENYLKTIIAAEFNKDINIDRHKVYDLVKVSGEVINNMLSFTNIDILGENIEFDQLS